MKSPIKSKVIPFVIVCIMLFVLSASSFAEGSWHSVYTNDFSTSTDVQIPEITGRFSADVNNGVLELKSDDICEWVANDLSSPNATTNIAGGIKVNGLGASSMERYEGGYTYNNKTYEYVCPSDVGWLMEEIAGKKAMRSLTYPRYNTSTQTLDSNRPLTSNYYKMRIVDNDKFLADIPGTYEFEVEYYIPAGAAVSSFNFAGATNSGLTKGEWTTWKFTKDIASLSGDMWLQMINIHPSYNPTATVYVHRISIKKASA